MRDCLLRIIGVAPGHGESPQNHFWELISGDLFLGVPVKWGFLFPKKEMPVLPLLGISAFGKREPVFGDSPKSDAAILGISCHLPECL